MKKFDKLYKKKICSIGSIRLLVSKSSKGIFFYILMKTKKTLE